MTMESFFQGRVYRMHWNKRITFKEYLLYSCMNVCLGILFIFVWVPTKNKKGVRSSRTVCQVKRHQTFLIAGLSSQALF